jgi:hypothetical protein
MKLPKFYNPFKPHIVQFANGKFAVRKWFFGWECCVDTHKQAAILRDKVHKKAPEPMKVAKVYG